LFKIPPFRRRVFYRGTTAGRRPAVMKMKPYRAIPLNSHKIFFRDALQSVNFFPMFPTGNGIIERVY
ncbi:MAG: hypothetical protein LBK82_17030, partial [Planctomycetaceae bacterium]|nr:hypothetical protein [Planctomycetaceae bacterium]